MKKSFFYSFLPAVLASLLVSCYSGKTGVSCSGNIRNVPVCEKNSSIPLQKAKCFAKEKYFSIYIPQTPSKVQETAAKELLSYLKRLYSSPIVFNGNKTKEMRFYIGRTKGEAEKLFAISPMREFGLFPSADPAVPAILIDGTDDPGISPWVSRGRTGTLLGVYYFLSRYAGIEFFAPGKKGEKLFPNTPVTLKKADIPVPSYPARSIALYSRSSKKEFTSSDYYKFFKQMLCSLPDYASPDFYYMGPDWKTLAKKNPELLGIRNGKRYYGKDYDVPCLTNPEVLRLMAEGAVKEIKRRGARCRNIRIFRDTSARICECKKCSEYKDISNYYYTFINSLAREIHKVYPHIYVMTQEKGNYFYHVPAGINKLENRFVIEISDGFPSSRNFTAALPLFEQWDKAGAIILFRQYNRVSFQWKDYPIINPMNIASHYKFMQGKALGTRWSDGGNTSLFQSIPMQYMQAKFLFDASADPEKVLKKFCSLAYPGAEEEMMRYFQIMEDNHHAYPQWGNPLFGALQHDNLIEPVSLLEKAVEKVKNPYWLAPVLADLKRVQILAEKEKTYMANYNRIKRAFDLQYGRGKLFTAPSVKGRVILDGKLDEKFWKEHPSFSLMPVAALKTPFQYSKIYMASSRKMLFCSFKGFEEYPEKIAKEEKNVWANDSLELMIAPPDKNYPYLQVLLTPAGIGSVIYYAAPGRPENLALKSVAGKAFIDRKEKFWSGEIAIPKNLLRNIVKEDRARFAVFRTRNMTDKSLESQISGLFPGKGNAHKISLYRPLLLSK
ncbi:MAG: DUF4838 domain-containing protein [Lentisphaeria bacterium]|nr:DUF4838 domain-containing protein [Lentisphaeria bacterium]